MKTFIFVHKNSSATLTLSAKDYSEARIELTLIVRYSLEWRCENEEGELEE